MLLKAIKVFTFYELFDNANNKIIPRYHELLNNMVEEVTSSPEIAIRWNAAAKIVEDFVLPPTNQNSIKLSFVKLLDLCDKFEIMKNNFDEVADIFTDPFVRKTAVSNMSRSYSEEIEIISRHINFEREKLHTEYRKILKLAQQTGAKFPNTLDSLLKNYAENAQHQAVTRSAISTELYVGALRCLTRSDDDAKKAVTILSQNKDKLLNVAADTRETILRDAESLALYHPIQSMQFMPTKWDNVAAGGGSAAVGSSGGGGSIRTTAAPHNIALPQSKICIKYKLQPLISKNQLVVPTTMGLNFQLIERLKTIEAVPTSQNKFVRNERFDTCLPQDGKLLVSTDPSTTYEVGSNFAGESWFPFAGLHPRVASYNQICETIILAKIAEDRSNGWTTQIKKQYDAAVMNGEEEKGLCNLDAMLASLNKYFEAAYDANVPSNYSEFHELMVPIKNLPNNYINLAVFSVTDKTTMRAIMQLESRSMIAKVKYESSAKNFRVSQIMTTIHIAKTIWKRLKKKFNFYDNAAFKESDMKKKVMLMSAFSRIITEALKEAELICDPPSLKLYVMTAPA